MSRAGNVQAAWRSYQARERRARSRPRLSSKKLAPKVSSTKMMSKRHSEPAKVGKSLPVKYSKLAAAKWRRCVGST